MAESLGMSRALVVTNLTEALVEDEFLPEAMPTKLPPPLVGKGRGRNKSLFGKKLPSANYAPEECPDPDKAWHAASLLAAGRSKRETCESVGICYKTLRRWETSPWWDEVYLDAVRTEHGDLKAAALDAALALAKDKDGPTVRFLLERLDPRGFGPPKVQAEIQAQTQAVVHASVETDTTLRIAPQEDAQEIAAILNQIGAFKHYGSEDDEVRPDEDSASDEKPEQPVQD